MKNLLLCGLFLLACTAAAGEKKVVSLSPALTELVCHLGKQDALVGRSVSCDLPANVKSLPVVGDFARPDLEKLAKLKPDLVLADTFQDAAVRRAMEALGVEVVVLPLNCMTDYRNAVQILGEKLAANDMAEREIRRVDRVLAGLKARYPETAKRPRVMYVVWHTPMMLPGKDAFLTEWITLAGGDSISRHHPRNYFRAAPEWVLKMKPDILIFPGGKADAFPGWWKSLPAVRNGHVFLPEDESLFYRLSPRFDRALAELEAMISKQ